MRRRRCEALSRRGAEHRVRCLRVAIPLAMHSVMHTDPLRQTKGRELGAVQAAMTVTLTESTEISTGIAASWRAMTSGMAASAQVVELRLRCRVSTAAWRVEVFEMVFLSRCVTAGTAAVTGSGRRQAAIVDAR